MNYSHHADLLNLIPETPADSIISRTIHNDDHVKAVLFSFAAGQELSEHTASVPAILHFIQGEAGLTLGQDHMEARAGTWAYMEAGLSHSIQARTSVIMALYMLK